MMKRMIARLAHLGGLAALVLISHWAWAATPEVFYVHNDQLGTPRAVVDGNNVEVWRWEGDAYGEQPPEQDPSGTGQAFVFNLRYPGQYYDVETGRMYNGWRDYDPSTGRYVQSDPLGLEGGQWSTYAYVEGNPSNAIDPSGLDAVLIGPGGIPLPIPLPPTPGMSGRDVLPSIPGYHRHDRGRNNACKASDEPPVPNATPGRKTRGVSDIWNKPGGVEQADRDFDSLNPTGVKDLPGGARGGKLADGRKLVVRPYSGTDGNGPPTLEIQDGRSRIKVRYW
ncbi:RHS repeat-associated core domain-containing protein [Chromobacterium haemolyticum]|uniref:RHS repeat-associated core domain-containing protein n=1 Tax=Chromobacterium haemolyticum TaxID=394935 RepID=UPI0009DB430A|nr:RHS repeat-associated core domain-containing protein [Chromobacterium haemolyticum]